MRAACCGCELIFDAIGFVVVVVVVVVEVVRALPCERVVVVVVVGVAWAWPCVAG